MQTKICRYCGSQFSASNAKIIYCSPSCRINFNAGKTFGAKSAQQTQPFSTVTIPPNPVTREEFQTLSAQMDQILQLLTTKE